MLYFCKHKQIMFNDYNYDYNFKKCRLNFQKCGENSTRTLAAPVLLFKRYVYVLFFKQNFFFQAY